MSDPPHKHRSGWLAGFLVFLIQVYRYTLSPLLHWIVPGSGCRFAPTCSVYGMEAIRTHGALRGSWLALRRFLRCHPWGGDGLDPVPPARKSADDLPFPTPSEKTPPHPPCRRTWFPFG